MNRALAFSFLAVGVVLLMGGWSGCQTQDFDRLRHRMVSEQIVGRGINDPRVIQAMLSVPRHKFVESKFQHQAYEDYPLPIAYNQTISQPYIVAYMTQAVALKPADRVLEIGTGSGYQAAVLAEIVNEVYTIELVEGLAKESSGRLKELGYKNIQVKQGDGFLGWPEKAPFDAIIVTAAPDHIPPKLIEQLREGGWMVIPVGSFDQDLYLITKTPSGVEQTRLLPVRFVPMIKGEEQGKGL